MNVLTIPSENEKYTFHTFIMHSLNILHAASSMVWNTKFIKYRENKLIVTEYVQNVRHWHEHKHTSTFAIGQLRHQSATAQSRTTHAVHAVAAHRCHELWSHTHVAELQTIAPDRWPPNSPDLNPVDYVIWSVIQLNAAGNILRVHYKGMKCDVSFSLGSVSMLFRWCGYFCYICVKQFFLLTTVQKLYKKMVKIFQIYDHKCTATFFSGSQCR